MKRILTIGSLAGLLMIKVMVSLSFGADPEPPKFDATGVWEVELTKGWTDCPGETPYPYVGPFNIVQDGNEFTGYDQTDTDYGTVFGNRYQIIEATLNSGGAETKSILWHLDSSTIGNGTYSRVRVDQDGICSFSFDLHFRKQGVCTATDTRMCLQNSRFSVRVFWEDEYGNTGDGHAIPATDDSGLFWFFSPNNMELLIKVLNGCSINNHFWVFFAATTDQKFTVRVTDLETEEQMEYTNPLKNPADAVTDTSAFATCP